MSYIVPGEKPRTCGVCPFARLSQINYGKCWCALDATNTRSYAASYEILDDCPLVELPPHGRLIDADALKSKFCHGKGNSDADSAWISTIRRAITQAETIIEAEESGIE